MGEAFGAIQANRTKTSGARCIRWRHAPLLHAGRNTDCARSLSCRGGVENEGTMVLKVGRLRRMNG